MDIHCEVSLRQEERRHIPGGEHRPSAHPSGSLFFFFYKNLLRAWHWWLTPIILATWEAEIRKIMIQSLKQTVHKTPSQKKKKSQNRADRVA
jgi:hypothetical protein